MTFLVRFLFDIKTLNVSSCCPNVNSKNILQVPKICNLCKSNKGCVSFGTRYYFIIFNLLIPMFPVISMIANVPQLLHKISRSSHRRCSLKKAVLKNFALFRGKYLSWSLFLIMLQAMRPAPLLKRDSNTGVFLRILRNFSEHQF